MNLFYLKTFFLAEATLSAYACRIIFLCFCNYLGRDIVDCVEGGRNGVNVEETKGGVGSFCYGIKIEVIFFLYFPLPAKTGGSGRGANGGWDIMSPHSK